MALSGGGGGSFETGATFGISGKMSSQRTPVTNYGGTQNVSTDLAAQLKRQDKMREQLFSLLGVQFGKKNKLESSGIFGDLFKSLTGEGGVQEIDGAGSLTTPLAQYNAQRGAEAEALIDQFGDSHRMKLERDFEASRNSSMARLEASGLAGSNLQPATESAAQEGFQQASLALEDLILDKRVNTRQNTTENVTDAALNERNQFMQILGPLLNIL